MYNVMNFYILQTLLPPAHFWKTAEGFVLGSVTFSAAILPYILVVIKASFFKINVQYVEKQYF